MLLNKYSASSLPFIVAMMSKDKGVEVVMRGSQAMTNGKQTVIPCIDLEKTQYSAVLKKWTDKGHDPAEVALAIIWALADHEAAGHNTHTDFTAYERIPTDKLTKHLANVIEDPRVDYLAGMDHPGSKINLRTFDELMYSDGPSSPAGDVDPLNLLHDYIFSTLIVNMLGHEVMEAFVEAEKPLMEATFTPEFTTKLDAILKRAEKARDTEDTVHLALEIKVLLEEENEKQQQDQPDPSDSQEQEGDEQNDSASDDSQEQDDAGSNGESGQGESSDEDEPQEDAPEAGGGADSDSSDEEAESDAEDGQSDDESGQDQPSGTDSSEEEQDGQGQDGDSSEQEKNGQPSSDSSEGDPEDSTGAGVDSEGDDEGDSQDAQSSTSSQTGNGDSAAEIKPNAFEQVLDPSNWDEMPKGRGEELMDLVNEIAKDCLMDNSQCVPALQVEYPEHLIFALDEDKVQAESSYLGGRLNSLLQSKEKRRVQHTRRGRRIDSRRVHRLAVGDTRIFKVEKEVKGVNTAIHFMMDNSYSMQDHEIILELDSVLAMGMALQHNRRFNLAVTAFPGYSDYDCSTLIRHGEPFTNEIGITTTRDMPLVRGIGHTPLGQAIWQILPDILACKEERKIIFVVTDGGPTPAEAAEQALEDARNHGVEAYALGVGVAEDAKATLYNLFGDSFRCIDSIDELADSVFELLEEALLK